MSSRVPQLTFWSGVDWMQPFANLSLAFGAFARRRAAPGQVVFRLVVQIGWNIDMVKPYGFVRTFPAWMDEPTAFAEYARTMRRRLF